MKASDKNPARLWAAFELRVKMAKVQDVFGVVGGEAVCAGEPPNCALVFTLSAWRTRGAPVRTDELSVRLPTSEAHGLDLADEVTTDSIVHIRARLGKAPTGIMAARAVRIVATNVSDDELKRCGDRLQRPVSANDKMLGAFAFDRSVDCFRGKCAWNGRNVELLLQTSDTADDQVNELLSTAHLLKASEKLWHARVDECIVKKLLPVYNSEWRQEDYPELTAAEFQRRLDLHRIIIRAEGQFEFLFRGEEDLFGGHLVAVRGNTAEGIRDLQLQG